MKNILITGGAGFIGSNLVDSLLKNPENKITCLDNFDSFYSPKVKRDNIKTHLKNSNYTLVKGDIRNLNKVRTKLSKHYDIIIHLAAKVGVGPSLRDPITYTKVNVNGTQNILELAHELKCKKFIFASSSSTYGINPNFPWREEDRNLLPISPYAATKISGELLGHVYAKLYNIQFIGLRFFSVYGPRQRPDLVIYKFTKLITDNKPIIIYGDGKSKRDYTYVDDIVSGIIATFDYSKSNYEIVNLGNNEPIELLKLIKILEKLLGKPAIISRSPEQPGDPPITFANISKARSILNYQPKTLLYDGLEKYISWFRKQHEKYKK